MEAISSADVGPAQRGNESPVIKQANNGDETHCSEHPSDCLSRLSGLLKEPIPEKADAKYIADTAQALVDTLNDKRKNDELVLDHFRHALETQTQKIIEKLQTQMYQTYETQSSLVDHKLRELFASLDRIAATEVELQNFGESLKVLFHEIHMNEKPSL